MEAFVKIRFSTEKEAEAVARAISPDNLGTPLNITISTSRQLTYMVTRVTGEMRLETLISTIDDILACVLAAQSATRSIRC